MHFAVSDLRRSGISFDTRSSFSGDGDLAVVINLTTDCSRLCESFSSRAGEKTGTGLSIDNDLRSRLLISGPLRSTVWLRAPWCSPTALESWDASILPSKACCTDSLNDTEDVSCGLIDCDRYSVRCLSMDVGEEMMDLQYHRLCFYMNFCCSRYCWTLFHLVWHVLRLALITEIVWWARVAL